MLLAVSTVWMWLMIFGGIAGGVGLFWGVGLLCGLDILELVVDIVCIVIDCWSDS